MDDVIVVVFNRLSITTTSVRYCVNYIWQFFFWGSEIRNADCVTGSRCLMLRRADGWARGARCEVGHRLECLPSWAKELPIGERYSPIVPQCAPEVLGNMNCMFLRGGSVHAPHDLAILCSLFYNAPSGHKAN